MTSKEEEFEALEPLNPDSIELPSSATGRRFSVQKVDTFETPAATTKRPSLESPTIPMVVIKRPSVDEGRGGSPAKGDNGYKVAPATNNNGGVVEIDMGDNHGTGKTGGDHVSNKEYLQIPGSEGKAYLDEMALYEDDLTRQGNVSQILSKITNYQAGITPNVSELDNDKPKQQKKANLGTILGVYLPCIQNIFGVLLFLRLTWIVGLAGVPEGFAIVFICCSCTMLTCFSLSAIATNGVVPAGGSYFMISRSLGPEFGGAVGILFFFGTSVAASMYIIGTVEILVKYMAPQLDMFGDVFNSYRLYGTAMLLLVFFIVFVGVGFVSKFGAVSLAGVLISILCIYIGIFVSSPERSDEVCYLGERLLTQKSVMWNGSFYCNKSESGPLFAHYCGSNNSDSESCQYFQQSETRVVEAIPGLSSGVFLKNINHRYTEEGNVIGTNVKGSAERGEIIADLTSTFMILIGIYFPSVTGILAGSNRSGDLADAQKSIPVGTIAACATTSLVYLSCVLFFAACIEGDIMRDKFGDSIGGALIIGMIAWPHQWVIVIGAFLSCLGAGLQSVTGAPRLLQAIAKDNVIPFLRVFSVTTKRGEPLRALLLTVSIAEIGILIGNLDHVAPIITMFFLMCYAFVNMACALQTLLQAPSWRPRFKYYHWSLSLVGLSLCLVLMFISSWYFALAALALALAIYKYIEYKGAEQEWGDGIRGLAMSAARYALLRLQSGPPHTKNWRPQLLVLMKLDEKLQPKHPKLVLFASQLKAGKGLVLVQSVLEGKFRERVEDAHQAKQGLINLIKRYNVKGFCDVSISSDVTEGVCQLIQNAGMGGLKHNTVVIGWPNNWRNSEDETSYRVFLDAVKDVSAAGLALLVPKGIDQFPDAGVKVRGTIDVWWIVHDGGLLMLLPFLLRQERTWKNCKLRIFTVAQHEDNSIQMKKDLQTYLYQLRIQADVDVIEMSKQDISAYTYEKTLLMEQRTDLLSKIKKLHGESANNSQLVPSVTLAMVPEEGHDHTEVNQRSIDKAQFTFTPSNAKGLLDTSRVPKKHNVQRMHNAVRLNEHVREKSLEAQLVVLNLPAPPRTEAGSESYMEFLEVLTEGLPRVLMVRGSGSEVITIYS